MQPKFFLIPLTAFASFLFLPGQASATQLESCGDVFVSADAACEFRPTEECETSCETVAMETSCAAELYASCESSCTNEASTTCTQECGEVCVTECEPAQTNEPKSSRGMCMSNCQQDCNDHCAEGDGRCRAACAHNCSKKCGRNCRDDDQEVECTPKCNTVCTDKCTATESRDCLVECESKSFERCETTLVERCNTKCETTGGAIFCDGQFLHAENWDNCAAEISGELSIDIDVHVEADIDVDGDGDAEVGCSMGGTPGKGSPLALGVMGVALAGYFVRRRRAQR
jgi:MYXO-CTERM domain-containing protein